MFLTDIYCQTIYISAKCMQFDSIYNMLRGPGGLHQNSLEIDFMVVSDGGG